MGDPSIDLTNGTLTFSSDVEVYNNGGYAKEQFIIKGHPLSFSPSLI